MMLLLSLFPPSLVATSSPASDRTLDRLELLAKTCEVELRGYQIGFNASF